MVYIPKKGTIAGIGGTSNPVVNQNEEEKNKTTNLINDIGLGLKNTYTPGTGNASTLPGETILGDVVKASSTMNSFLPISVASNINSDRDAIINSGLQNMKTNILSGDRGVDKTDIDYIKNLVGGDFSGYNDTSTINLLTNTLEKEAAKEEEEKESAIDKKSLLNWLNPAYPFTYVTNLEIKHIIKPAINYISGLFRDDDVAALETKTAVSAVSMHGNDLPEEDQRDYNNYISQLVELGKYVDNGQVTKAQYEDAIKEVANEYKNKFPIYSTLAAPEAEDFSIKTATDYIKSDIDALKDVYGYQQKINTIDPDYANKKTYEELLQKKSISNVMTKFTEGLGYAPAKLDKKALSNKAYASLADQIGRWNNSMASARITLNKLMAICDGDPSKLEGENREIYNEIQRLATVYDKFEENLGKLYKVIPSLADPATGKIVMPDMIAGKSLHDWLFDGMDNLLTNEDYGYSLMGRNSVSTIDVLENMSGRITNMYSNANRSILNPARAWSNLQYYGGRIVGGNATEIVAQQGLGRMWATTYNLVAKKSGKLSFDYMNQDFTLLSTMNTNRTRAGGLIQKYSAQVAERGPEVIEGIAEIFLGNAATDALKASKFSRVLANKGLMNFLSESWKYAGTAEDLASQAAKGNNITKSLSIWDKIRNYGSNIVNYTNDLASAEGIARLNIGGKIVEVGLDDLSAARRLANYIFLEIPREVMLDQLWDARFANADTELGSDTSMIFSMGGTALGTLLPKLVKSGLFGIGSSTIDLVNKSINDVLDGGLIQKTWGDGNSFDLVKLIDKDSMPVFDALAKTKFGLNSSRLAYWEELASFSGILGDVSKALEVAMKEVKGLGKIDALTGYSQDMKKFIAIQMSNVFGTNSQISNRVWQLVADERTNPADIFKYVLQLRGTMQLGGWRSSIKLADDSVPRFVRQYDETLDLLPSFSNGGFGRGLNEGFTMIELNELKKAGYSWADISNFKRNKDGRFNFTKDGLEKAGGDIAYQSMDTPLLAKVTDNAQDFDVLMRQSNIRKVSDETLDMIRDTGTYDVLAEALGRMPEICGLKGI